MHEKESRDLPGQSENQTVTPAEGSPENAKLTAEQIQQLLDGERKRLKDTRSTVSLKRTAAIMIAFLVILAGLFWLAAELASDLAPEPEKPQLTITLVRFLLPVLIISIVLVVIVYLARRLTRT